jgi:hypothetical protein
MGAGDLDFSVTTIYPLKLDGILSYPVRGIGQGRLELRVDGSIAHFHPAGECEGDGAADLGSLVMGLIVFLLTGVSID